MDQQPLPLPLGEPRRKKQRTNDQPLHPQPQPQPQPQHATRPSAPQSTTNTTNNDIIEILSDEEEEPEIIQLSEEEDNAAPSQEIQITGVNTANPTPLRLPSLFIANEDETLDDNDNNNDDEIEITDIRQAPNNNGHRFVVLHTPFGDFQTQRPVLPPIQSRNSPATRVLPPLLTNTNTSRRSNTPQARRRRGGNNATPQRNGLPIPRGLSPWINAQRQDEFNFGPHTGFLDFMRNIARIENMYYNENSDEDYIPRQGGEQEPMNMDSVIDQSILQRIEYENERELDERLRRENNYNKKVLMEKQELIKKESPGHTNTIKSDESLVCELCSIELGEGIPGDFKPDVRYDKNLKKYGEQYQVPAPWFCINQLSEVDKELSKRIFVAKCGHCFCGRCVKNIGNRPKRTKKLAGYSILNPTLYAPSKCPAVECTHKFRATSFTELYF